jgi:hypothetical protein
MDERDVAVERIVGNAPLRLGRRERTATARLTVAVAWVASIGHGRSQLNAYQSSSYQSS